MHTVEVTYEEEKTREVQIEFPLYRRGWACSGEHERSEYYDCVGPKETVRDELPTYHDPPDGDIEQVTIRTFPTLWDLEEGESLGFLQGLGSCALTTSEWTTVYTNAPELLKNSPMEDL